MPPTMQRINMNGYGGVEALFTETAPAPPGTKRAKS